MRLYKIGKAIVDLESVEVIYVHVSDDSDSEYEIKVDFKWGKNAVVVFTGSEKECNDIIDKTMVEMYKTNVEFTRP